MRRLILAGAALVLWTGLAPVGVAQDKTPDAVTWLQARPLNLLDHGLETLRTELREVASEWGPDMQAAASYDRASGRIVLSMHDVSEGAATDAEGCRAVLNRVRQAGGIDLDSGLPLDEVSYYASAFTPPGGDESGAPEGWLAALDGKMNLIAILGPGDKAVRCSGPLLAAGAG